MSAGTAITPSAAAAEDGRAARWHRRALRALNAGDLEAADRACAKVLSLDPDHADALFILAVCHLRRGNPTEAMSGFERATALVPDRAEYWAQQASCLSQLGRQAGALAAVRRATDCLPADALTHDTLGTVLTLVGRHQEAAEQFEAATRLVPGKAQFQYNHATSLMFCGAMDRAEAAFQRVLQIDPHHALAHLGLAENFTVSAPSERIASLEATLSRVRGDVDSELIMSQALARTLEAAGDTGRAFACFEQSKRKKKQSVGYTIDDDRHIYSAIERLFDAKSVAEWKPAMGVDSRAPIFVMGMPRTGTTLLERVLSSHSAIASGGELSSLPQSVWAAGGRRGRIIHPDSWPVALAQDPTGIGENYLEHARTTVGDAGRFIDKRPLNYYLIGFIRRALPNARIVCLRRGALDTCVAHFRHLFALNFVSYRYALTLEDTAEYFSLFERLMDHWDALFPGSIYQLRYEALVMDFDSEIRRLLDYLELPYEAALGDFHRNEAPVATASAVQVRQPLYRSSVGAWRRYEAHLGPLKERLTELGVEWAGIDQEPNATAS